MFIVNPFVKYVCKYEGNYVCEYKSKCGGECICKYLTTEKLILSRINGSLFKLPWIKAVLPYVKTVHMNLYKVQVLISLSLGI